MSPRWPRGSRDSAGREHSPPRRGPAGAGAPCQRFASLSVCLFKSLPCLRSGSRAVEKCHPLQEGLARPCPSRSIPGPAAEPLTEPLAEPPPAGQRGRALPWPCRARLGEPGPGYREGFPPPSPRTGPLGEPAQTPAGLPAPPALCGDMAGPWGHGGAVGTPRPAGTPPGAEGGGRKPRGGRSSLLLYGPGQDPALWGEHGHSPPLFW